MATTNMDEETVGLSNGQTVSLDMQNVMEAVNRIHKAVGGLACSRFPKS